MFTCLYVSPVPDIARVKTWRVKEMNGWVYVWHHAEGENPYWVPPEIEEITKGEWTYRGRTEHIVNAQIQVTLATAYHQCPCIPYHIWYMYICWTDPQCHSAKIQWHLTL